MMPKKKKKPKLTTLRFRKNDADHNLLAAVQHWVKAHGGSLVLVGGAGILHYGSADELRFQVVINCLGKRPATIADKTARGEKQ